MMLWGSLENMVVWIIHAVLASYSYNEVLEQQADKHNTYVVFS